MKKEQPGSTKKENIRNALLLLIILGVIAFILCCLEGSVVWNIVVLLLILTILIFVHEFGHFIMAKIFGVHVHEFALGMGPKVLGFKRKNDPTLYSLRALPIGGYCQMAGEEGEDDDTLPKDKFMCNKSKLRRVCILVAGVVMNFITAIILLFFIALIFGSTEQRSYIGHVEENSPASKAGIKKGDKVIGLNGHSVGTWDKISIVSSFKNKKEVYKYEILHQDGKVSEYELIPETYVQIEGKNILVTDENTMEDILDEYNIKEEDAVVAKLIGIGAEAEKKKGIGNAINYAITKFGSMISTMFLVIGSLITGKLGLDALAGPVGMYSVVGTVASYGIANIIYLMAYLSVNLGVINILPFPAFDGGRVLFVGIEAITRKKVDAKVEGAFHTIGFILLMILMLYITFQDILRLF